VPDKAVDPNARGQPDAGGLPSSRSRPPLSLAVYFVVVLAVAVIDALDGGLSASAQGGVAVWSGLAFGVFWRLRSAWIVLILVHCGDVVLYTSRGEFWQSALNLVLTAILVSRPTRNYVARPKGRPWSR
jgi:hypothetical protein